MSFLDDPNLEPDEPDIVSGILTVVFIVLLVVLASVQ